MTLGYIAYDKAGFAIRSYIVRRPADAQRAAEFELGDSLKMVRKFPLHVVKYPFDDDKHLTPADLTGNHGWSTLTPWDAP